MYDCFSAISQWMSANRLKLNADKNELMWVGTKYTVASLLHNRDICVSCDTYDAHLIVTVQLH